MFGGKREMLARGMFWSGATFLLGQLPQRDLLLVLNYHRITNGGKDPFDTPGLITTGEQLDEQLSYLKRHVSLVTLEEAVAFADGKIREKTPRCRVLVTFDDGYLDNYEVAFPILRSHGVQGVFFLVTAWVGSENVPWWDRVAYLVKTARERRFTLRYPTDMAVDLDADGVTKTLQNITQHFFRADNADHERYIRELGEISKGQDLPQKQRRYLDWNEAREMIRGGMAMGSHTHTHLNLSDFEADRQRQELAQSRTILREQLGIEADTLSYPYGHVAGFTDQTQQLAQELGYRAAFSFYGGTNLPGLTRNFDLKRVGMDDQSRPRFRAQAAVCRLTGKYWP